MIRFKNMGEFLVDLSIPGTQSAANDLKTFLVPFAMTLKAIYAKVGTAGITGTQVTDIKKNGVSIFSGAGKLNFATTATACTYGALSTNPPTFVKGDVITVDTTAVNSGTAAKNLNVLLAFMRSKAAPEVGAIQTDTVGLASE